MDHGYGLIQKAHSSRLKGKDVWGANPAVKLKSIAYGSQVFLCERLILGWKV